MTVYINHPLETQCKGNLQKLNKCVLTGIFDFHIDDFLWYCSKTFPSLVMPHMKTAFQVEGEEHNSFSYVRMTISSGNGEIHVHQSTYKKSIQPIVIDPARAVMYGSTDRP